MIVFCDFHHGGLYHAMHKLFVERLGYEMYRPIGMDWVTRGYWYVSDLAWAIGERGRARAIELFGKEAIAAKWRALLLGEAQA